MVKGSKAREGKRMCVLRLQLEFIVNIIASVYSCIASGSFYSLDLIRYVQKTGNRGGPEQEDFSEGT
jgi:hypothetical protein